MCFIVFFYKHASLWVLPLDLQFSRSENNKNWIKYINTRKCRFYWIIKWITNLCWCLFNLYLLFFLAHKTMNRKLYSEKFIMNRFLAVLKTYRCKNILKLITKIIYGLFINAFTPYGRSQRLPQWPSRWEQVIDEDCEGTELPDCANSWVTAATWVGNLFTI